MMNCPDEDRFKGCVNCQKVDMFNSANPSQITCDSCQKADGYVELKAPGLEWSSYGGAICVHESEFWDCQE